MPSKVPSVHLGEKKKGPRLCYFDHRGKREKRSGGMLLKREEQKKEENAWFPLSRISLHKTKKKGDDIVLWRRTHKKRKNNTETR